MQERPEKFNAAKGESEATLVAPRFDAEEARRAHPVVPLAEARPRAPLADARAHPRGGGRRSLTPALIAVALLASAAVGGAVATKVFPGPQSDPAAAQAPAEAAPAQAAEVAAEVQARPETPPTADVPREVVDTPREEAGTKPEARTPRVTRARRAEDAGVPARVEAVRDQAEDFEGVDEGRRGRGRGKRRERVEDDGEKEMRRVLKRAKDKAPRLIDVLVNPR
jgi:hypothetical protein